MAGLSVLDCRSGRVEKTRGIVFGAVRRSCAVTNVALFPTLRQHRSSGKVLMMPVPRTSTYLSTEEVAQLLGFSVRTVTLWFNQWHETGGQQGIPGFKVGKSWRAERKEIEAWIERQKVRPVQAAGVPLRQAL
jgi:predicted DNA-binding transcriptional regulator AlpA